MDTIYAGLEKQKINQIVERIMDQREQLAAAFIAATGLHPIEYEQVEKRYTNPDGTITTRFHIRKCKNLVIGHTIPNTPNGIPTVVTLPNSPTTVSLKTVPNTANTAVAPSTK